jgi:large subunit ribosomal protein L10
VGLTREQKAQRTRELAERLKDVRALYLADFTGLDVQRLTELRRQLGAAGARLVVVKNTLARRAVQGLDSQEIEAFLSGPTALVVGTEDAMTPARILREFALENEQRPTVRAGIIERRLVTGEEIETLATLPPREVVLAGIAGSLGSGAAGIAGALAAVLRNVALLVEQVAKKQAAGTLPPAEE